MALAAIAIEAGAAILEVYSRGPIAVEEKADSSPLTEADLLAEAIILERLANLFPDIPVIAEEAVANGHLPEVTDTFFLVDPLDGSKEFISRNGEFTVNIARIDNGIPTLGIVYAPALKRIWWGNMEAGSFVSTVEEERIASPLKISTRSLHRQGLTLVGSRSHGSGEGDPRLEGLAIIDHASMGSSLKFCLVAEGNADLYPRFGRTMEWDTAAGDAVLRAAGGAVVDCEAQPLQYGKCNQVHDSDYANPQFWALGDDALLDHISKVGLGAAAQ
ncbi:3'(2'),5'-bisphosphate nucleotidase CysQ [Pelagibacterium lacus]|uniref:3'(2'),5'-bisphosphate nucleotidase CysQ n=1 Tax=Pelagibacterium lacus TaxID=2282655 RepID=A0A369W0J8_9HYPH|nr:3'(2'),5'-bisphosphate nucleotidase CysQ [Pelagibacterium lacus]RDE07569.1 3'(2'),5'-bisphosphate nucleotidase [Pelagibacterium lacus]